MKKPKQTDKGLRNALAYESQGGEEEQQSESGKHFNDSMRNVYNRQKQQDRDDGVEECVL